MIKSLRSHFKPLSILKFHALCLPPVTSQLPLLPPSSDFLLSTHPFVFGSLSSGFCSSHHNIVAEVANDFPDSKLKRLAAVLSLLELAEALNNMDDLSLKGTDSLTSTCYIFCSALFLGKASSSSSACHICMGVLRDSVLTHGSSCSATHTPW